MRSDYVRKIVIAGNWKMHKTKEEVEAFFKGLDSLTTKEGVEAVICSPFPYLETVVERSKSIPVACGAQTMHFEESGAFTGEVSPVMLKDIGVTYVIIGHSERRQYFNETDETVNKKVHAAHAQELTPIVCVGESLEQREANKTLSFIEKQVKEALRGVKETQIARTIIAYEPIWAIGTGKTASSEDANEVCKHIREVIKSLTSEEVANKVTIQYGGSVNPDNIAELLATSDIDGALVGGASLEAESFMKLVEAGNEKK